MQYLEIRSYERKPRGSRRMLAYREKAELEWIATTLRGSLPCLGQQRPAKAAHDEWDDTIGRG